MKDTQTQKAFEVEAIGKFIVNALGGDNCHNIDRIGRLIGTANHPDEKKLKKGRLKAQSCIVSHKPENVYKLDDFPRPKTGQLKNTTASPEVLFEESQVIILNEEGLNNLNLSKDQKEIIIHGRLVGKDTPLGKDDSRSGYLWRLIISLLSKGFPDGIIKSIITNPCFKISESVLDKRGRAHEYAEQQILKAKKYLVESNGYNHAQDYNKPSILVEPGNLPSIIKAGEDALIKAGCHIYQHGTILVRLVSGGNSEVSSESITRESNSTFLAPVKKHWLTEQLAKSANWYQPTKEGEENKKCDPSLKISAHILEREGDWSFPLLTGIINSPSLTLDGKLLQTEGYDKETGILLNFGGTNFSEIPEFPNKSDALEALKTLQPLFRNFPFVDESSKSVPLAAICTGIMRKNIDTAPMFCVDAPVAGTGKSMMCEIVGMVCDGHKPPAMNQGSTPEEDEKRISSCLISGDNVVLLDNCTRPIEGDLYCSMLSQTSVAIRILGKSERVKLPTKVLLMATGNNLVISGDMIRRVMLCRLDPKMEKPEERQFDSDPRELVRNDRSKYVVAALTMVKAYINAGCPCPLPKIGSFEQWNIIRETLVWLDCADPANTRAVLSENDPTKNELLEFLTLWYRVYAEQTKSLNQMRQDCENSNPGTDKYNLYQFFLNISRSKVISNRSVGRFLTSHKDRIISGAVLRKKSASDAAYWHIDILDQQAWNSVHDEAVKIDEII